MSDNQGPSLVDLFDQIVQLQKTNPEQVNSKIEEILDVEIQRMSHGDADRLLKLQQIQWKINGELRKYRDPVARMNKMTELFWKGVYEFVDTLKM